MSRKAVKLIHGKYRLRNEGKEESERQISAADEFIILAEKYCMEQLEKQKENWNERGCPSGFEALRDILCKSILF